MPSFHWCKQINDTLIKNRCVNNCHHYYTVRNVQLMRYTWWNMPDIQSIIDSSNHSRSLLNSKLWLHWLLLTTLFIKSLHRLLQECDLFLYIPAYIFYCSPICDIWLFPHHISDLCYFDPFLLLCCFDLLLLVQRYLWKLIRIFNISYVK